MSARSLSLVNVFVFVLVVGTWGEFPIDDKISNVVANLFDAQLAER